MGVWERQTQQHLYAHTPILPYRDAETEGFRVQENTRQCVSTWGRNSQQYLSFRAHRQAQGRERSRTAEREISIISSTGGEHPFVRDENLPQTGLRERRNLPDSSRLAALAPTDIRNRRSGAVTRKSSSASPRCLRQEPYPATRDLAGVRRESSPRSAARNTSLS